MTPDDRLKRALDLSQSTPSGPDRAFTARVLEGVERRRLAVRLAAATIWAAALALPIWVLRPVLDEVVEALAAAAPGLAGAGLLAVAAWRLRRTDLSAVVRRLARLGSPAWR